MGLEPMIPAFERANTFDALDHVATAVIRPYGRLQIIATEVSYPPIPNIVGICKFPSLIFTM
jgi:hypothetical protein